MTEAIAAHRPSLVASVENRDLPQIAASEGRPIAVVLGMHRSGTSLCSHVLSVLGADMSDDIEASAPDNRKGQWERLELREFHDRVLALFGHGYFDPQHDLPLPAGWWADPRVRSIRQQMTAFLRERMPEAQLFGFKDPRTMLLLPLWHQICDEMKLAPRIALCLRNPAQVARSLADRDGLDDKLGEYRWLSYMAEALGNLRDWEICPIEYEDWFADPAINLGKLTEFFDLRWRGSPAELSRVLSSILDPGLRHDDPDLAQPRQPLVRALYEGARKLRRDGAAGEAVAAIVDQFTLMRQLEQPLYRRFEAAPSKEEVATLRERLAAAEQQFAAELAERNAALEAARAELAARNGALAAASGELKALEEQLAAARDERENAHAELAERNAALDAASRQLAAAEEQLAAVRDEGEAARTELAERNAVLAAANGRLAAIEKELAAAREERGWFANVADAAQAAVDELRARLNQTEERAKGELAGRDKALAAAQSAADGLREQLAQAEGERDAIAEELDDLAVAHDRLADERDRAAADASGWFEAAIFAEAQRVARSRRRRGWRLGRHVLNFAPARGRGSPMYRADRARAAREWHGAARYYLDALAQLPGEQPAVWVQLGHALKEAGQPIAAEFAYRHAIALDERNADAPVPLGQVLRRQGRDAEAAAVYRRALELPLRAEERTFAVGELAALSQPAPAPEADRE